MTDTVSTPDPMDSTASDITVGGSITTTAEGQVLPDAPVVQGDPAAPTNINPGTGEPYPPMGVPVDQSSTDNPDRVAGDRVYMSITWRDLSKDDALAVRDAAVAAAPELASYEVYFAEAADGNL